MKVTRTYTWKGKDGKDQSLTVNYTLITNNGQLTRVINQHGYSCEPNSEVFEHFSKTL